MTERGRSETCTCRNPHDVRAQAATRRGDIPCNGPGVNGKPVKWVGCPRYVFTVLLPGLREAGRVARTYEHSYLVRQRCSYGGRGEDGSISAVRRCFAGLGGSWLHDQLPDGQLASPVGPRPCLIPAVWAGNLTTVRSHRQ